MKKYKHLEIQSNETLAEFVYRTWEHVDSRDVQEFYTPLDPNGVGRSFSAYEHIYQRRKMNPSYEVQEDSPKSKHRSLMTEKISVRTLKRNEIKGSIDMGVKEADEITPEDIMKRVSLNPRYYEMKDWTTKTWDIKRGDKTIEMVGINFTAIPKQGVSLEIDEINKLVKEIKKSIPSIKVPKSNTVKGLNPNKMVEIPLVDVHLNKYSEKETSGQDFNTLKAEKRLNHIFDTVLSENRDAAKFIVTIGQDLFNIDNIMKSTTSGTPQDVHLSYEKMFKRAIEIFCKQLIKLLKTGAQVEVIYEAGNHDKLTSWHLVMLLSAVFAKETSIKFDTSPLKRKYRKWGTNLICWTHGDKDIKNLSTIMQYEAPKLWATTTHREIHAGHFHTMSTTETGGVVIRRLSSISGTDRWHHESGYVASRQATQVFIWDKKDGLHSIREISFRK